MAIPTTVEILDLSLNVITQVKALMVYDRNGSILQYSRELSDYGRCRFRVSTGDRLFTDFGDILVPHKNHVRIRKGTKVVWQGAIVDNTKRTKDYIDVVGFEYEFYLDRNLIKRTSADINGTTEIYRIFKSGTMATAVTAIANETIADYASSEHILKTMTIGTIENPDYPKGLITDYNGDALTGAWSFGEGTSSAKGPTLQYDYHTVMYVLKSFGAYSYADFDIDYNLKFNFKKFLGVKQQDKLIFSYGQQGNIVDYNAKRLGQQQLNTITAIATDYNGVMVHANVRDSASVTTYGMLEGVAAYADIKGTGILKTRINAELPLVSNPDDSNVSIYLNESSYPLGLYDIGDLATIKIKDSSIDLKQIRRIVGITVIEHNTGREAIALETNKPYSWEL